MAPWLRILQTKKIRQKDPLKLGRSLMTACVGGTCIMTLDKTIIHITSRVEKMHTYTYIFMYVNENPVAQLIISEVDYLLWDL